MNQNSSTAPSHQATETLQRHRYLPVVGIGLTVLILIATVFLVRQQLRRQIREQIIGRDGEILSALALMEQYDDASESGLIGSLEQPHNQWAMVFNLSRLTMVVAARLFTEEGKFEVGSSPQVAEADLSAPDLAALQKLKPVSHFHPRAHLGDYFLQEPPATAAPEPEVPILEVNVPLHAKGQRRLLGVAQFIVDGKSMAAEFAALDQHLIRQMALPTLAGSGIVVLALGWAFRRIQTINRLLSERTASLLRANQELSLAAKVSAVGAVTAHLIHGLKNPLSGLHSFVTQHGPAKAAEPNGDWELAAASAQRMKRLIDEVVRVVQDEQGGASYQITLAELGELIGEKVRPLAKSAGVEFEVRRTAEGSLSNRDGNLILLILENLVRNGIQATPNGRTVELRLLQSNSHLVCEVQDEGPGFPEAVRNSLFTPCRSSKEGGTGIGLAISRQLALHLNAELVLKSSTPHGCVFCLTVPCQVWSESATPTP